MVVDEHSFPARYGRFIARSSSLILGVATLILVGSIYLASRLELRTAFSELLPSDDPGVVALRKTETRMGDMSLLLVGVHSPDREANLRYAEAITQKLSALPKEMLAFATYHVRDLRSFFEANRLLYLSENDLVEIRDRLRSEIAKRKNPLLLDLSEDEESVDEMKQRYAKRDLLGGRFPNGVFSNQDGTYVWVAALPPGGLFGERAGEKIYEYAKQLIVDLDPQSFHPQMTAHVGGPVATLVATRHTVEQDILWVTIICVVVIAISLVIYFRRLRSIPLVGIPGVLGTVMAFAVADLAFGYVNSSTAFLGSIILGNGINYAIILISRYEELRADGQISEHALAGALNSVVRGTIVATLCASAAYATLMLTSFRGFYQFGVMAAFGVLFCWLATFIVLPAVLYRLDRRSIARVQKLRPPLQFTVLRSLLGKHTGIVVLISSVLTLASLYGLTHFLSAPFEYDFSKLSARLALSDEVKAYNQSINSLFGRWPSPTIILADDVSEVESIRDAIYRQDKQGGREIVGQVLTIYDILPGTPEAQARRLELLAQIRKLVRDPSLDELAPKERDTLMALDPPDELRILNPQDLPFLIRRPFTEADGTVGRVVLFYPKEHGLSVWNGRDLLRISEVVQSLYLEKEKKTIQTSGGAVVFAAMIRSVLHDGPIATIASLLAVILVIFVAMRPFRSAIAAVATMIIGVVWMVGIAGLWGVQITFLNFIALPITFGIGAEYALNLASRYRQEADMIKAVVSTGGAVVMCSWTTIVGYGSLLAARNRALQGFGTMAILGEIFCLAAAILALPAIILWRERRRHPSANRA
jgi:predicted RND superfamily exporter protein